MSDTPLGPGWWKASDDKWYAPELHPDYVAEAPSDLPPSEPPPPAADNSSAGGKGGGSKALIGIVVAVALVAAAFVVITQIGGDEASAATVDLDSIGTSGTNPFFASFAPEPTASLLDFAVAADDDPDNEDEGQDAAEADPDATDRAVAYRSLDGSVPGLYGGTLNEAACDADQLVAFLAADQDKASAWADVLEIDPNDIDDYVAGLTPVNLGADTRVVTHGFADGNATAREAILQRGTATMIDRFGVPRVNCYSGSPLLQPEPISGEESYAGEEWESFTPAEVVIVDQAATEQASFDLRDVDTGAMFSRPVGTKGDHDGARVSRPAEGERMVDGPIEIGRAYEDRIEDGRTQARYTFDAPEGSIITVTVANRQTSNSQIRVGLSSSGSRHLNFVLRAGDSTEEKVVLDHSTAGEFEIFFEEGPAAFSFQVDIETQDDAGQGGDAGDDSASAFEIRPGSYDGLLAGLDTEDRYLVELVPGAEFGLSVAVPRESRSRVEVLIRHEGDQLLNEYVNPGGSGEWKYLFSGDHRGFVEIRLREGPADYSFAVTMTPQTDGGADGDAGNTLADAREVAVGEELTGQVGQGDAADFYTFAHPGTAGTIQVENSVTARSRVEVILQDPTGSGVGSVYVNAGAVGEIAFGPDQEGSVYRLIVRDGRADYMFSIVPDGAAGEASDAEGG